MSRVVRVKTQIYFSACERVIHVPTFPKVWNVPTFPKFSGRKQFFYPHKMLNFISKRLLAFKGIYLHDSLYLLYPIYGFLYNRTIFWIIACFCMYVCRIKLYGSNTVGRWNWNRNQYLAVFNFIWLGAQYRPTLPNRHGISLYVCISWRVL